MKQKFNPGTNNILMKCKKNTVEHDAKELLKILGGDEYELHIYQVDSGCTSKGYEFLTLKIYNKKRGI